MCRRWHCSPLQSVLMFFSSGYSVIPKLMKEFTKALSHRCHKTLCVQTHGSFMLRSKVHQRITTMTRPYYLTRDADTTNVSFTIRLGKLASRKPFMCKLAISIDVRDDGNVCLNRFCRVSPKQQWVLQRGHASPWSELEFGWTRWSGRFLSIFWPFSWVAEDDLKSSRLTATFWEEILPHSSPCFTGPNLQERFPFFGHDLQIMCVSYDNLLYSILFFFIPFLFSCMCVCVRVQGVLMCGCMFVYMHILMCMGGGLRLIIKSQLWSVLRLIHLSRRQGLPPNPKSPNTTQRLSIQPRASWHG